MANRIQPIAKAAMLIRRPVAEVFEAFVTRSPGARGLVVGLWFIGLAIPGVAVGEAWPQYKLDGRHSGDAADRDVTLPLGLIWLDQSRARKEEFVSYMEAFPPLL